jgi:N-acyl-D-aspartate/D-glutamate deacylase
MHDTIISQGEVFDGTGAPAQRTDIAIDNGLISAVGNIQGPARQFIDARDLTVTPGFIDVHTHYDGQVSWDSLLTPSSLHGVTTAVMGNCGVGFAPVRQSDRDWLIRLMEGVEDIPGTALSEGIQWQWESFEQYLDTLGEKRYTMDIAAQIPHGPLRTYVLGERGADHRYQPTAGEIETMAQHVASALRAGAVGFTTSRTEVHRSSSGEAIPSLSATADELLGIAAAMAQCERGVFELVSDFAPLDTELDLIEQIARVSQRPVSVALTQTNEQPDQWREVLNFIADARVRGLDIHAQVAARPVGVMMGLAGNAHFLLASPAYHRYRALPLTQQLEELRKPAVKADILQQLDLGLLPSPLLYDWQHIYPFDTGLNYFPDANSSIAALAAGKDLAAQALAYDVLTGSENHYLYYTARNFSERNSQAVSEMLASPHSVLGLGDAGAHCGVLCDASVPTFLLTHWCDGRERSGLSFAQGVHKLTQQAARAWGLRDRGTIAVGQRADINLINRDELRLHSPRLQHDLPAQGARMMQGASGYVMTLVAGAIVSEQGSFSGTLPGKLIRQ